MRIQGVPDTIDLCGLWNKVPLAKLQQVLKQTSLITEGMSRSNEKRSIHGLNQFIHSNLTTTRLDHWSSNAVRSAKWRKREQWEDSVADMRKASTT